MNRTIAAMGGQGGRVYLWGGALFLALALGLHVWYQHRLTSAVKVAGQVVRADCYSPESCHPILRYTTLEGRTFEVRGDAAVSATTFEVGDEWREILYWPGDPSNADEPSEGVVWGVLAILAVAIGLVLVALGGADATLLPAPDEQRRRPWAWRVAAMALGAALLVTAFVLVHPRAWAGTITLIVIATGACVAVLIRLLRASASNPRHERVEWGVLCWTLGLFGATTGLGLLVLPVALHPALLAAAPLAVALTLPQQMWRWPALEKAVLEARARRSLRRRIDDAVSGAGAGGEMLVRLDVIGDAELEVVRRTRDGDVPLRVLPGAFLGKVVPRVGTWYLLVGPALDQIPTQGGGGYRTAGSVSALVGARSVEALGTDLDEVLRGDPARRPARLLLPPVVLGVAVTFGGAFALADREPALSGAPIPRTGLRERFEHDRTLAGRVLASDRPPIEADWTCTIDVEPSSSERNCWVGVACGGESIYGEPGGYAKCLTSAAGALVAEDTSPTDGDPAIRIDTRTRRVVVRSESPKWAVAIEIVGR